MEDYIRWSLHQLFLLYFQPSRFQRAAEGDGRDRPKLTWRERFRYLLKMLPCILAFAIAGNLLAGCLYDQFGIHYHWLDSWEGVVFGVGAGVVFGVGLGVVFGVGLGVVLGVVFGVGLGVVFGVGLGVVFGVGLGVVFGVGAGVVFGVGAGVVFGVGLGVVFGVGAGVVFGVGAGVVFGVGAGVGLGVGLGVGFWLTYFRLAAYPLDTGLSVCAWMLRGQGPQRLHRAWKLCPIRWNEVIYLPLPFAARLLALLAKEDREEGLRQISFVAAERPLQRHVALAALQEVALGDLQVNALPAMETAAERLVWAADAPLALPKEFGEARPRFERAAQYVGQYRALHNAFRKQEALQRAVREVEGLQAILIGERGRFAVRLLQTANGWRELLEREQTTLRTQIEAVREIPNPFVFGNAIPEAEQKVFIGRQDIVQQIERSILGAAHVPVLLLHGPRRMGKTSILNQLPRLLGNDFAPAAMDCQNPAVRESAATLLRYLSRTLSDGLRRRRVTVTPLSVDALAREPFAVFDEWLDGVERAMPPNLRVLLCLDEYERLQETLDAGWGAAFLDALRHTLQHRPRLVLMFTGAHTFAELGPAWTDRFISARRVRVSFLSPDEVRPLLTRPISEFDMTYAPGALEAVLRNTHGQPFLTQAVAFELVEHLNRQQRKQAACDDVEAALTAALASGGEYFANVWSDAGVEGQAILRAVARNETLPDSLRAHAWLREHDVLTPAGSFAVPMVERWVRENA